MTAAHEREFAHAGRWTVVVSFTVAGGARRLTAEGRAVKIAARLVSAAARLAGVVEVRAVAGPTSPTEDFVPLAPRRVRFDAANSGHGTYWQPKPRDRYLDPEHERALGSLAEANRAAEARRRAEESRRAAVGCANRYAYARTLRREQVLCDCVYCAPTLFVAGLAPERDAFSFDRPRCVCGRPPDQRERRRCWSHTTAAIVVLEGDPSGVVEAARLDPAIAEASP